jgi:hypothetical protein
MHLDKTSITVEFKNIGPVLFERSDRAQRMNISIKPKTGVRVAVPNGISFQTAINFAKSNTSWIQRRQKRMKELLEKNKRIGEVSNIPAAKELLRMRLNELAKQYGYTFNKVFIKQLKTMWGSCSEKNNINLNLKLVLFPAKLMDYIILHELVHTRHKNHGPLFWKELDKITGDAKALSKKVKYFGVGLLS